jgi:ribosome maturation factor RimP
MAGQSERVSEAVRPAVTAAGYDLEEVAVTPAGRRSVVRVVVDSDDGVDLDAVAEISRAVGAALDAAGAMGESAYVLEVTSPGVDRPLTQPRHWRRATGRLVQTTTAAGDAVTGRVVLADDSVVVLDVDGHEQTYRFDEVSPATVQIEFNPPPGVRRSGSPA